MPDRVHPPQPNPVLPVSGWGGPVPKDPAPHRFTVPAMGSNTPQKYRPRAVVEAIQWDGTALGAIPIIDWIRDNGGDARYACPAGVQCTDHHCGNPHWINIDTPRGIESTRDNDWIILGTTGEFFTRTPEQFAKDYIPEPTDPIRAAQERVAKAQREFQEAMQSLAAAAAAAVVPSTPRVVSAPIHFSGDIEDLSRLSPNAQRMVNAFRGDQP